MFKKLFYFVAVLYINGAAMFAQSELSFEFDYARFNYDESSMFLEFYYEINSKGMVAVETPNGIIAEAIVRIEMKNALADTFLINKDWMIQNVLDTSMQERQISVLTGTFGFVVPEGNYTLQVKVHDVHNPAFQKTIDEQISITPYKEGGFAISDIELAKNIKRDDTDPNSIFYKNTLEVFPNPSMVFSNYSPVVFYYMEMYNLKSEDPSTDYTLQKILYNSQGSQVLMQEKQVKQSESAIVEVGLFNLSKQPTDSYNIVVNLIDNKTKHAFISSKRFFHYNPGVVDSSAVGILSSGLVGSEFSEYSAEECDRMFAQAKYISTRNEVNQYNKLDSLDAKRKFLFNFWKNRDSDPATPRNEFKEDYMRRVEYVNSNYRHMGREGFLSDRGRIYLMYGEPDQRDFYPSVQNLKPYEVWFYNNIEGGVSFYFGDISGFGNYQLLHSNKRGEVTDENWQQRITVQ